MQQENLVLKRIRDAMRLINERSGYGSINIVLQNGQCQIMETSIKEKEIFKFENSN